MTDLMQESKLTMMQRRVRRIFFLIHFNMFFYLHHLLGTLWLSERLKYTTKTHKGPNKLGPRWYMAGKGQEKFKQVQENQNPEYDWKEWSVWQGASNCTNWEKWDLEKIKSDEYLIFPGITDEDKKDLVHWMAYREKRPPSPSPQEIIEKIRKPSSKEKDRFSECEKFFI